MLCLVVNTRQNTLLSGQHVCGESTNKDPDATMVAHEYELKAEPDNTLGDYRPKKVERRLWYDPRVEIPVMESNGVVIKRKADVNLESSPKAPRKEIIKVRNTSVILINVVKTVKVTKIVD